MNCNNIYDNINNSYNHDGIMSLSQEECDAIQKECLNYEDMRAVSIEALKIVQKNRGWVSDDAIILIARILGVSVSDLEGVATFYNQIFRQPVGRHIVRYCDSVVCYLLGCETIKKNLIDTLGIEIGQTTVNHRFTLLPMCCVGACDKAPIVMVNNDIYYYVVSKRIVSLLKCYL